MSQESIGVVNRVLQKHFKNSVKYNEEQKPFIHELTAKDVITRILSFLLDSIFMFWPSMIFIISILLLTSPANIGARLVISTWELTALYITSILCFNTISSMYWVGQTIGLRYYDLKIVKKDHSELTMTHVIMREFVGVSLPWVIILLSYSMISFTTFIALFILFLLGNLGFIIFDKRHRSPIDILLGTKIIRLPDDDEIKICDEQVNDEEIIEEKEETTEPEDVQSVKEEPAIEEPKEEVDIIEEAVKEETPQEEPMVEPEEEPQETESIDLTPEIIEEEPKEKEKAPSKVVDNVSENVTKEKQVDTKKEKSVTEIISEAVSVVDQALENKKEIYPVKIEKIKKKEGNKEKTEEVEKEDKGIEVKKVEEVEVKVEEVKEEEKIIQESMISESDKKETVKNKKAPNKNQKKKNGKNTKTPAKKITVKTKDIKPLSSVKIPAKKSK